MRIQEIEIVWVRVPAHRGAVNSPELDHPLHKMSDGLSDAWTVQFDTVEKHLLIARCDDGTTAVGEGLRGVRRDLVQALAGRLVGRSVEQLQWRALPIPRSRAYDGFEILVLDLLGKAWGAPVHALLGGAVRSHVDVGAWSGHRTPADAATIATRAVADGFTTLKLKCDANDDLGKIASAVKDAVGDALSLIFDPNERLGEVRSAVQALRQLEQVGNVVCVEDPLPHWDLESYRHLRERTDVPIALHVALGYAEHGQRMQDLLSAHALRAADIYNLSGGVADFLQMSQIADVQGVPYWHGSEVDLGVMEAAHVHTAAVSPGCVIPSDVFSRLIREDDLLAQPLKIEAGAVLVPSGPGLGVDIDPRALDKYATERTTVR